MNKTKIIVVEDNIVYCEYVCNMLSREGYRNMKAYHLSTAKKHLQQATDNDIVVADLRLPDGNGIDLLRWMRKEGKMQPFIIMTDYAEVNTAVESMKLGSIDYIPKQLVEDKLVPLIRSILKERQAGQRRMPIFAREGSAFQKIMHRIRLVAATDMSVMIFGENGTGKEHIAHLLHDKSKRAGKPFVAVDCGSLSKELAPSAFFGHVKGAFTGADNAKKGYFHEAEGGTLFLDEVGNLALETQQMLLRAIQERRYRPVGDKADRNFNVRIIAATNEDLEVSVNEKRFRQDLLYRLHDFGITVPPLRDCQEDIMPLAEFFRDMANRELECSVSGFSSEARKALLTHAWPGNVRELRQKVMGAVLQAQEGVVMKEHLELAVTKPTSTVNFALRNDAEDKERILRALKQANGNRSVLAHARAVQYTSCAVVDKRRSIDTPFIRVAQYGVDALLFELGYKFVLVISALQHGKDGAFRHVCQFPILDFRFGTDKLLLYGFIACGLPEKRGFERVAHLVTLVVRDGIDQPVILPSAHVAPRFLHRHII